MNSNYLGSSSTAYEHRVIAEKALGRPLPDGAEVHHVDGNPKNNSRSNLVICDNRQHHVWIHYRTRAYDACGNADYVKCEYCKKYDDPEGMYTARRPNGKGFRARHRSCHAEARRK